MIVSYTTFYEFINWDFTELFAASLTGIVTFFQNFGFLSMGEYGVRSVSIYYLASIFIIVPVFFSILKTSRQYLSAFKRPVTFAGAVLISLSALIFKLFSTLATSPKIWKKFVPRYISDQRLRDFVFGYLRMFFAKKRVSGCPSARRQFLSHSKVSKRGKANFKVSGNLHVWKSFSVSQFYEFLKLNFWVSSRHGVSFSIIVLILLTLSVPVNLYAYDYKFNPHTGRLDAVGADDESDINIVCGDNEILKYSTGTGEWACAADDGGAGAGDIDTVGDCTTGACFSGTSGTILTFNVASGDTTVAYAADEVLFKFSKGIKTSGDVHIVGDEVKFAVASGDQNILYGADEALFKLSKGIKTSGDVYVIGGDVVVGAGGATDYNFLQVNAETTDLTQSWLEDEAVLKSVSSLANGDIAALFGSASSGFQSLINIIPSLGVSAFGVSGTGFGAGFIESRTESATDGPVMAFVVNDGTTVNDGTMIGRVDFNGQADSASDLGARVAGFADGAWSSTSSPGKLGFFTNLSGVLGTTGVERFMIYNNGLGVWNETGVATADLRMETDGKENGFLLDSSANALLLDLAYTSISNGATGAGTIRFLEDTDDGSNYLAMNTAARASDLTLTWNVTPGTCTGDGNAGALTINGSNEIVCSADDGGSGSDTNAIKEFYWPASATLPLQVSDSIPPIAKTNGTNVDELSVLFDSATDECRTVSFKVPSDVTTGNVTIRVDWRMTPAISGDVIWDFRHNSGTTNGASVDVALTTVAASASTAQSILGKMTTTTWTETVTNLAWAASDEVYAEFCRDANNASDTATSDAYVIGFGVEIPRA